MSSWLTGTLSGILGSGTSSSDSFASSAVSIEQAATLLRTLEESSVPDIRRRTLLSIKDLSQVSAAHKAIGQSLHPLITLLKTSKDDTETIKEIIHILINIMTVGVEPKPLPPDSVEFANAETFLKDTKNVGILLTLLEEKDHTIRYHTTQLLRILLATRTDVVQHSILTSPMGIPKLMDLLRENREIVRNEALLLLLDLTKSNQEIQKIVAFEGAFEILLSIIRDEGYNEGGIIVQDCLQLVNNLIRENVSNQNYFRETSCIAKLPPLLAISSSDLFILTDDKRDILLLSLETISLLVAGSNPSSHTNQTVLAKGHGFLNLILPLALGRISVASIRIKSLLTLANILYGNKENFTTFSTMSIATDFGNNEQATPALSRLLIVALNSKDSAERTAAVRVFKCFLYENEEGQMALASTLTPPPTLGNSETDPGTHLINALFAWEDSDEHLPYRSWYASYILSYILKDNSTSKELVLKIPLEIPKPGVPITTLLIKCMRSLTLAARIQSTKQNAMAKIALLRLLSLWTDNCPSAVKAFLQTPNNLPFVSHLIHLYSG